MTSAAWQLITKPSFLNDLLAIPNKMARQVQRKVEELRLDPLPDGQHKKKVRSQSKPIYRLRAGDYRVFYAFGEGWIWLLGLRKHHEGYDEDVWSAPTPAAPLPAAPTDGLLLEVTPNDPAPDPPVLLLQRPLAPRETLPRPVTAEFLAELRIPEKFHRDLLACTDADALLAAPVPQEVLGRVLDTLFEQPVEAVLQQPDLIVAESEDLIRFREGRIGLEDFLLRLDPEQEKKVDWALKGPVLIKGGPGSGKSTLALHRVRALLDCATPGGQPAFQILFATFTNTLVSFSRQLLMRMLGAKRIRQVTLDTADRLARRIVLRHGGIGGEIVTDRQTREALRQARADLLPPGDVSPEIDVRREVLGKLGDNYLLDEFTWVIEGRELQSRGAYLQAERGGRGLGLTQREREVVWGSTRRSGAASTAAAWSPTDKFEKLRWAWSSEVSTARSSTRCSSTRLRT